MASGIVCSAMTNSDVEFQSDDFSAGKLFLRIETLNLQ